MIPDLDEADLHAFLDGELSAEQEAVVRAWLERNPTARERLREYAEHKLLLRAGFPKPVEPQAETAPTAPPDHRRPAWGWRRMAGVVAASVALGWLAHAAADDVWPDPPLPDYVADAAPLYHQHADAASPGGIPEEFVAAEASALVSDRLGETVALPEPGDADLRLTDVKVLELDERPLAHLAYQDRQGRRYALIVSPDGGETEPDRRLVQVDADLVAEIWSNGEQSFALLAERRQLGIDAVVDRFAAASAHRSAESGRR